VLRRAPRRRDEPLADRAFLGTIALTGMLTAGVALAVYLYALERESVEMARGYAFTALVAAELLRTFGARSDSRSIFAVGFASNVRLLVVVLVSLALQLLLPHVEWLSLTFKVPAMPLAHGLLLVACGLFPLLVLEIVKATRRRGVDPA
jgi:Ca2+-transporting ATPase